MTTGLDTGTYEVLRDRLAAQAAELARRAEALNARRTEEFGSTRLELTGTARLDTEHPAVPRDLVAVGDTLLFGRQVSLGGTRETTVADVLALHDRHDLRRLPEDAVPGLLDDPDFVREFAALHRYYRQARLLQLRCVDGKLLAVFRTGEKADDIRVLRWALADDGRSAAFLDAHGERDHVLPPSYDVEWVETTREDQVPGRHPHVRIQDGLYVSTVGGTLTVKVEDDTETGEGIYSEPVDEPLQSSADAEIAYARVGVLVLLRVRPYKEEAHRYLVFNTLTKGVVRLDGIGLSCRRLPEERGIVFPGGYCLATGVWKTFEVDTTGLELERVVRSPNGEDVLFAYRARVSGRGLLLPYNLIRKEVATPLSGQGWALFDDGVLVVLGAGGEAGRVHPVRIWRTPFVSDTYAAAQLVGSGPLFRVGNAELVRGVSDCLSLAGAVAGMEPTAEVYEALVAACVRAADSYHWLGDAELGDLGGPLEDVRVTAEQVLAEFETVRALTRRAADALAEATDRLTGLVRRLRGEAPQDAAGWVGGLTELRRTQGHLLTLKELRYADLARIDETVAGAEAELGAFGQRAVAFLARADAFAGHHEVIAELVARAGELATVAESAPVAARLNELTDGLRTVTEVIAGLDIGDATVRTSILERIAEVLGGVNRARATLDARRRELQDREGRAEFAAEFALLGQSVTGALADAATPEACDTRLARLLVQLENLEARFADFDDFLAELTSRRTEIYETFSARKQTLADERARRAEQLAASGVRVLETVERRAATLADTDAVSTFFASDPMATKIRRTVDRLRDLGDRMRAEELTGRLAAAREEAVRALRDRTDLYTDGGRTLRLGRHRFAVNTEPLDLTLVPAGDGLAFALTGTDYRSPVSDAEFAATRAYWDRPLPSESPRVYRAEHLAARLLDEHGAQALAQEPDLAALVRRAAQESYDEGYERGVHDHDATAILRALLRRYEGAGLLRHEPAARARALLFWTHGTSAEERAGWTRRARSLARVRDTFGPTPAVADFLAELARRTDEPTAAYLFDELTTAPEGFVLSATARTLLDKFRRTMGSSAYDDDVRAVEDLAARRQLVEAWLTAYTTASGTEADPGDLAEAVAAELCPDVARYESDARLTETVTGLLGTHPRIEAGSLSVRIDELLARTREFRAVDIPGHRAYQRRRTALVAAERARLRLDEYRPRVMSSFVRGRLVDEVYLPLIGDNLARQIGTTGEGRRTGADGGLLLLVSPPGYGKTTLMEYVADRLGLVLVKVSGPALGHGVTSLDPAEAPNATARQEVEKVNFALAAGTNVLLHLDDIQHTSPELLQKFIPLCDATRRIEGVWEGAPRTYDLRGKRFAVCMTGNPYTESGGRFRVPDMLANRADVWNLGDVLTGKETVFALSFLENALTSHPVLAPLAGRDRADLDLLIRLAAGDPTAHADRLSYACDPAELTRITGVLRHLVTARDTVLAVNSAYMASAATTDAARTEPPFRLQGSYRTMNRIAQRIEPVMNSPELSAVLDDHYTAEAQTLGAGAEANLLKLGELRGTLTAEQALRWGELKAAYVRERGVAEDDPLRRAVAALGLLAERVGAVEAAITRATGPG
ncbi:DNA repair ATPase [Streptomyces sp. MBT65]|uniref:DNA repair ATPase n=1 Tax=Streptomyces sp. MBT65 TaxID=1488395 RepID=UPI00190ACABF|nr:DNA repair ATPase [Streptomyces sp. MBT65]MBK3578301.1 DNA repair ATPase [Streptomyces sp. MBT65]